MIPTGEDASYNFNDDTVDHLSSNRLEILLNDASGKWFYTDDNLYALL